MATKSIFKDINIKQKKDVVSFIAALENSEKKKGIYVSDSKKHIDASEQEIKKLFGV